MDPTTLIMAFMTQMGWGVYIPLVLAIIGLFSAISTVYPATWPGANVVHKLAGLIGNAKPAVPAGGAPAPQALPLSKP